MHAARIALDELFQFTALGFFAFALVAVFTGNRNATSVALLGLSVLLVLVSQITQQYQVQHAEPVVALALLSSLAGLASSLLQTVHRHHGVRTQHAGIPDASRAADSSASRVMPAPSAPGSGQSVTAPTLQQPPASTMPMQPSAACSAGDSHGHAQPLTPHERQHQVPPPPPHQQQQQQQQQHEQLQQQQLNDEDGSFSMWQQLPDMVMCEVLSCVGLHDARSLRLVCRDWRTAVGCCVTHLAPPGLPPGQPATTFPLLKSLDLGACLQGARPSRLAGLSALAHLTRLELGCGARGVAPAIHDAHLTTLARVWGAGAPGQGSGGPAAAAAPSPSLTPAARVVPHQGSTRGAGGLQALGLAHCVHITDFGVLTVLNVSTLTSINLTGCVAVSDVALSMLATRLPGLVQLDIPWCLKVSNSGLKALAGAHSSLTSLNISGCPLVGETGLGALGALTGLSRLSALHLGAAQPAVTDASLAALAPLTRLTSLALGAMAAGSAGPVGAGGRVTDNGLAALSAAHPHLAALSLSCMDGVGDAGLGALLEALPALTSLHVRGCPRITAAVLPAVAALAGLRELDLLNCPALELGPGACAQLLRTHTQQQGGAVVPRGATPQQATPRRVSPLTSLSLGSFNAGGGGAGGTAQLDTACMDVVCTCAGSSLVSLTLTSYQGVITPDHAACLPALTSLELHGALAVDDGSLAALCQSPSTTSLCTLLIKRPSASLTPAGLSALSACTSLTSLELGHTHGALTDGVAALLAATLPGLVSLGCAHSLVLGDVGVGALAALTRLTALDLAHCSWVTGVGFTHWASPATCGDSAAGQAAGSSSVAPTHAGMSASPAHSAGSLQPRLRALTLSGCSKLGNAGLEALSARLTSLTRLDLAECPDISDAGVGALSRLVLLTSVDLALCSRLTDASLSTLAALPALTTLKLNSCIRLGDAGMGALAKKANTLLTLHLDKCIKVTNQGVQHVAHITSLTSLRMARCPEITDEGVSALSRLSRLSTLSLAHCTSVSGAGLMALSCLTSLASLEF